MIDAPEGPILVAAIRDPYQGRRIQRGGITPLAVGGFLGWHSPALSLASMCTVITAPSLDRATPTRSAHHGSPRRHLAA